MDNIKKLKSALELAKLRFENRMNYSNTAHLSILNFSRDLEGSFKLKDKVNTLIIIDRYQEYAANAFKKDKAKIMEDYAPVVKAPVSAWFSGDNKKEAFY
ncbi:hypothetical protein AVV36_gp096 [Pectobacterium bacteriophage PM2]|uniref:Thioredoxin n=1 Tax=Pectobacterium bacteriophage PM2 TaxID=1429794 RepID=A0A0A0Q0L6_9CAUD|nr:hypothetical protein AVV36_gp096 [Pectobacterium bacteriophage PM2]AHY25058.1 hypothetical protein PM2_096 [Pectobacterium bacteriophage PM2]